MLKYLHGICDIFNICPQSRKEIVKMPHDNFHLKNKAQRSQARHSLEAAVPQVQHRQHRGVHRVQVVPDVATRGQERFPPRLRENFHSENGENTM